MEKNSKKEKAKSKINEDNIWTESEEEIRNWERI